VEGAYKFKQTSAANRDVADVTTVITTADVSVVVIATADVSVVVIATAACATSVVALPVALVALVPRI
jgi:hypothetical protein